MSCNHRRPTDGRRHAQPRPTLRRRRQPPPRTARRALLLGLVLLLGLPGAVTSAVGPASAHGRGANGCTGVPDSGPGFAFHGPCDNHDRCYGDQPYGDGSGGRRTCDRVFRSEMLRYCGRHGFGLRRAACGAVAHAYHAGVRSLGAPFWALDRPAPVA